MELFRLNGKTALVTGCTRGIGSAMAIALAEAGASGQEVCWSPDGNFFYVGRRGCTIDEFSIHHLSSKRAAPNRTLRFPSESGRVYALKAMPNKRHLLW